MKVNNTNNMKKISTGLLILAASLGVTSCSQDDGFNGGDGETGGIALSLSTDGRVMRQTRADDSVSPVVPNSSEFGISLKKSDGSYSKTWNNLDLFNRENAFPIGDYTLSAEYGSLNSEGFEAPCYKGTTSVHVSPSATSEVAVVATLANAMVSVRYTDEFKNSFPNYSAAVQTEGHEWVVFAQNETRPAYIAPSEVKLNLTLTNSEGKQVTIQPAGFTAQARHHYVVTIGVSTQSGGLKLDVVFDDEVIAETISVSLGDELFNAPAPSIKTKGFTDGADNSTFEYAAYKNEAEFDVFAFGGIKSATLNVVGFTPAFGQSVELVNAEALTQQQLASDGVDCAGFFRNVDKMGVVDIRKFISNLPSGEYTVQLQVVDLMTRTTEPVSFKVAVAPVLSEFSSTVSPSFRSTEVAVDLATNCEEIKDNVTFRAPNSLGQMVSAKIKSVAPIAAAGGVRPRADLAYKYRYILEIDPVIKQSFKVEATLGRKAPEIIDVTVTGPAYDVVADAFARKVVLKITAENDDIMKYVCENVQFYNDKTLIPTANIKHEAANLISISGLTSATTYSNIILNVNGFEKKVDPFITESEAQVPNGDFSQTLNTINITKINAGGTYQYGANKMQNYSSIYVNEPTYWASINQKTCWTGADPQNTWFVVPSTIASDGAVTVRSVAYDHHGTLPDHDDHGLKVREKYSRNAPKSFANHSAGELFLGSYSFDGTEHRVDGTEFGSRPSVVSFDYKYTSINNEKAEAYVALLAADGTEISAVTKELSASSDMQNVTMQMPSYPFGKKATKIIVKFISAKGDNVSAPIPSDLKDVTDKYELKDHEIGTNAYKSLCVGSILTVDNVSLGYDSGVSARNAKRHVKTAKRR